MRSTELQATESNINRKIGSCREKLLGARNPAMENLRCLFVCLFVCVCVLVLFFAVNLILHATMGETGALREMSVFWCAICLAILLRDYLL